MYTKGPFVSSLTDMGGYIHTIKILWDEERASHSRDIEMEYNYLKITMGARTRSRNQRQQKQKRQRRTAMMRMRTGREIQIEKPNTIIGGK